ncbi:Fc receptor, IgE, high affinity I, gamma polypeptide like [Anableps anableps]
MVLLQNGQRAVHFLFCHTSSFFRHFDVSLIVYEGSEQSGSFDSFSEPAGDMNVCYILDGVLILYGIILTVLYCRLRMRPYGKTPASHSEKQPADGGIYAGLTAHSTDTYETIKMDKKPIV